MTERWEFPAVRDALVFNSREDAEEYLARGRLLVGASGSSTKAAMARLQDEFRHLLVHGALPLAVEDLRRRDLALRHA
jgi:exocyst complex protein 7